MTAAVAPLAVVPDKIIDLSKAKAEHHSERRPYVYFEEMAHGPIKIGYVGTLKEGLRRTKNYARMGATLLAVIPGRDIEERELHGFFKDELTDGREYFAPSNRLLEFIERLLERRYAAPSYEAAASLGTVDFSIWKPGSPSLQNAVDLDGQISLFSALPVRERIAQIGQNFSTMSLTDDWYTPPKWVELARAVMGDIDLDPASTRQANDNCVKARCWYTKEQNGLDLNHKWFGRMWINPPYGSGPNSQKMFMARLHREVKNKTVEQAITCLNLNAMCNKWFCAELAPIAAAHCIPWERIEFVPPAGIDRSLGSAVNGTVFTYVGPNVDRFVAVYAEHGQVLLPTRPHGLWGPQ
jgi:hypothetical protein